MAGEKSDLGAANQDRGQGPDRPMRRREGRYRGGRSAVQHSVLRAVSDPRLADTSCRSSALGVYVPYSTQSDGFCPSQKSAGIFFIEIPRQRPAGVCTTDSTQTACFKHDRKLNPEFSIEPRSVLVPWVRWGCKSGQSVRDLGTVTVFEQCPPLPALIYIALSRCLRQLSCPTSILDRVHC